jgi:hypothetical protein
MQLYDIVSSNTHIEEKVSAFRRKRKRYSWTEKNNIISIFEETKRELENQNIHQTDQEILSNLVVRLHFNPLYIKVNESMIRKWINRKNAVRKTR